MFLPGAFPQRPSQRCILVRSGHDEAMIIITGNLTKDVKLHVN